MRLIDADALMDKLLLTAVIADDKCVEEEYYFSKDLIQKAPTIEAVPVIRCDDCKYYTFGECNFWNHRGESTRPLVYEDDFCSRAERKEHEAD